jgi:hypothetical protein
MTSKGSWSTFALFFSLFLLFLTVTYDHSKSWNNPNKGDQDLDLTLGLRIKQFEALSDGYHHPLFPALFAMFAEKRLIYFAKAKLLNVAIGALAFWVVAWVGLRAVGPVPTLLALAALCPSLSNKSAELTAEPLLLLLITLTFHWLVNGFEQPRLWFLAGATGGLAYLTKGSALLLLFGYAASIARVAPKTLLRPRVMFFPLMFFVMAAPLLLYNWQVFGSPFFNYNTAHVLWLDSTEEQSTMFEKGLPTMRSYLATHGTGDIVWRFLKGLALVRGIEWVSPFLLIFLVVPSQWFAYFREFPEKQRRTDVATTLVLTFYLPFAWDAVVQRGIRYLLPLFPVIFLLLADFLTFYGVRLSLWLWPPSIVARLGRLVVAGSVAALGAMWIVQLGTGQFQGPFVVDFEDQATAEVYHLLDSPAFDGKQVLFGPSHQFTGTWLFHHNVAFPSIPPGLPPTSFRSWLEYNEIDYILVNRHMIQRRADTVREYFAYSPAEGVTIVQLEQGWEMVYRGPPPTKFALVKVR